MKSDLFSHYVNLKIVFGTSILLLILLASCNYVQAPTTEPLPPSQTTQATEETLAPTDRVATLISENTSAEETVKSPSQITSENLSPSETEEPPITYADNICSDCLFPRAVEHSYEVDYEGIVVKFGIAIDSTVANHELGITDFEFDEDNKSNGKGDFAKTILQMHHYGYLKDNPGSNVSFDQYLEMVRNGGGQYTTMGSKDRAGLTWQEGKDAERLMVNPSKKMTMVISYKLNPLFIADNTKMWISQHIDGSIDFRVSGLPDGSLYGANSNGMLETLWGLAIPRRFFDIGFLILTADEYLINPKNEKRVAQEMGEVSQSFWDMTDPLCRLNGPDDKPVTKVVISR